DGRVDEPARRLRGVESDADELAQERARRDRLGRAGVQAHELGVRPEAAAGEVEGAEPGDEQPPRGRERGRGGDRDDRGRAEGAQARAGDHDPPETATGAALAGAGAAAAGCGAEGAAANPEGTVAAGAGTAGTAAAPLGGAGEETGGAGGEGAGAEGELADPPRPGVAGADPLGRLRGAVHPSPRFPGEMRGR